MKIPTILIAEDDADDQLLLKAAFEESGENQRLIFVDDGVELMHFLDEAAQKDELSATHLPDFIIMDLNMPRKSGREALLEVKTHPVYRHIPVVIYTTTRDTLEVRRCYSMGANSYVVKPSTFEAMIKVAERLRAYWIVVATLPPVKDAAR